MLLKRIRFVIKMIKIGPITYGEFVKRPSATCKTPYVADVLVGNELKLCHSLSLGCCGLIDKGTTSQMILTDIDNCKRVCSYRIQFVKLPTNVFVCVNPKMSEDLVECVFNEKLFPENLKLNDSICVKRETTFKINKNEKSRFDFSGIDSSNNKWVLEVKSVPLVDERNVSYFPDGYRKKKDSVVSPRALKHINHLVEIKKQGYRSFLVFCIQRSDSMGSKISDNDKVYKDAVQKASQEGVNIVAIYFDWEEETSSNMIFAKLNRIEEVIFNDS